MRSYFNLKNKKCPIYAVCGVSQTPNFRKFCEVLFHYQYVQNESELTDGMIQWLYEHSGGVLAVVVALVHDAQELSILNGREILDKVSLIEAYEPRQMLGGKFYGM